MTKCTVLAYQYRALSLSASRTDICVPHCSDTNFRWVTEQVAVECRMYSIAQPSTWGWVAALKVLWERGPGLLRQDSSWARQLKWEYRQLGLMSLWIETEQLDKYSVIYMQCSANIFGFFFTKHFSLIVILKQHHFHMNLPASRSLWLQLV